MTARPKPVVLCILDGWGHSEEADHNAIAAAHTPHWDGLLREFPHGVIHASEGEVGLPCGQMGNSEVGHMNIGAGRIVMQDLPRIDAAITDGSLARHPELEGFIAKLKQSGGNCHLMGLLSDGGVHSHMDHMIALANIIAEAGVHVCLHAFLDGRDTPPKSAEVYLRKLGAALHKDVEISSIIGRYYAMDRDKRWDRVAKAYDALVDAKAERYETPLAGLHAAYAQGTSDEFVLPMVHRDYAGMSDGDGILMVNFRADRARQILNALIDDRFDGFARTRTVRFSGALGMAEYSESLARLMPALFPPQSLEKILGEVVAEAGLAQLRIAETEKYAHVTFFFSGGREEPFTGEERILVPSPDVATYDLKPEMSAFEVTEKLEEAIGSGRFDLIVVNYANTDMVGHSGDLIAATKAVEAVDACLGRLRHAVLNAGGAMLITADHGNAESMHDAHSDQPHTAHTLNLVPAVLISEHLRGKPTPVRTGRLADIAPTLLAMLCLPIPSQMTGQPLIAANALAA